LPVKKFLQTSLRRAPRYVGSGGREARRRAAPPAAKARQFRFGSAEPSSSAGPAHAVFVVGAGDCRTRVARRDVMEPPQSDGHAEGTDTRGGALEIADGATIGDALHALDSRRRRRTSSRSTVSRRDRRRALAPETTKLTIIRPSAAAEAADTLVRPGPSAQDGRSQGAM